MDCGHGDEPSERGSLAGHLVEIGSEFHDELPADVKQAVE
jgi:hypothetical protein